MLDYVITSRNIQPSQILDVRILISADIGTDHNLASNKIIIVYMQKLNKPTLIYEEKINDELLEEDSIREFYARRLTHYLTQEQHSTDNDIENM